MDGGRDDPVRVARTPVRGFADPPPVSWLALAEVILSLVFFASTVLYLRPFKRRARQSHAK